MAVKTTVFVSSTSEDLKEHRAAVAGLLPKGGFVPVGMEGFGARHGRPLEVCLREVGDADLFVGFYAWRCGFLPEGVPPSITERELLEAEGWDKPRFCFLVDEAFPWPDEYRDQGDAARRLAELKARLGRERVLARFANPDQLAGLVLAALSEWREERSTSSPTPERDRQLTLVGKVHRLWVAGAPAPLVPLALDREERVLATALAIPGAEEARPGEPGRPLLRFFLEHGRSLLLRGEPGAGKSQTLRQLFVELADRARRDPEMPIPVLFNLASWKGETLAGWLTHQLGAGFSYGVAPQLAAEWIARDQVLPLLDGLDEVDLERRPDCVRALNAFLGEHGLLGMAVCCRSAAYEELFELPQPPEPLKLEAEIALQPLSPEQIATAVSGDPGEPVRGLLEKDPRWRDLARSPLLLDLLQKTLRATPPAARPEALAGLEDGGDRSSRVFAGYVSAMLDRKDEAARYSPEATRKGLAWLAGRMQKEGQSIFRIEQLQPSWLPGGAARLAYAVLSRVAVGCLLVLPLVPWWTPALWLLFGLLGGALVGVTDALRLRPGVKAAGKGGLLRAVGRVALVALETFVLFLLLGWLWVRSEPRWLDWLPFVFSSAILCGLLFGLVFGLRGAARDGGSDIRIGPGLHWSRWSWRATRRGIAWVVGTALLVLFAYGRAVAFGAADTPLKTQGWLVLLTVLTLAGGLGGGVLGGLEPKPLDTRIGPNRGVWLALRNAGLIGLLVLLTTAAGLSALLWAIEGLRRQVAPDQEGAGLFLLYAFPWVAGLALALWFGLWASGMDFLAHFTLRLLLALRAPLPADWDRFLRHAADHGLLRRNGGTYAFYHGLLQEYFAFSGAPGRFSGAEKKI